MLTAAQTEIVVYVTRDGQMICVNCHSTFHDSERFYNLDFCDCPASICEYSACESGENPDGLYCDICGKEIAAPDEDEDDQESSEDGLSVGERAFYDGWADDLDVQYFSKSLRALENIRLVGIENPLPESEQAIRERQEAIEGCGAQAAVERDCQLIDALGELDSEAIPTADELHAELARQFNYST